MSEESVLAFLDWLGCDKTRTDLWQVHCPNPDHGNRGGDRKKSLGVKLDGKGVLLPGSTVFRHTCASMLFEQGRNAVQVQRWLGHHSATFTLATYVHLLDGDLGEPLVLSARRERLIRVELVS